LAHVSVFDGFENQDELKYYYPTNLLVTGWDIMFFWVARMIMAGYEWAPELLGKELAAQKGVQPFRRVFHRHGARQQAPEDVEITRKLARRPQTHRRI
jgi:valyl-tRNA synthetase